VNKELNMALLAKEQDDDAPVPAFMGTPVHQLIKSRDLSG